LLPKKEISFIVKQPISKNIMKNQTSYSKSSIDISKEESERIKSEKQLVIKQKKAISVLKKGNHRKNCILCGEKITGGYFNHRDIKFIFCNNCGHIQTGIIPPKNYLEKTGYNFHSIYPNINKKDYDNRKRRIYKPKLDWIIRSFGSMGYSPKKLKNLKWVEIGCGNGYFLSCLSDFGVKNYIGLETDKNMIEVAKKKLNGNRIFSAPSDSSKILKDFPAQIYVAFFVFEHFEETSKFLKALSRVPPKTILIFSVPTFGFSSILENIFKNDYARNMDGVIHTQIFTDQSISYLLKEVNFEKKFEWIFGQDSTDMARIIKTKIRNEPIIYKLIEKKITGAIDQIQSAFDHSRLADQRHIIAIKK